VPEDHQQRAADEVKAATQRLNEAIRAAAAASLVVEVSTFDMREMQQPRPVPRLVVRISRDL
jgi:hypothetical protein